MATPTIPTDVLQGVAAYRESLRRANAVLPGWNPLEWSATLTIKVGQVGYAAMKIAQPESTGASGDEDATRQDGASEYRQLLVQLIAGAADALEAFNDSQKEAPDD